MIYYRHKETKTVISLEKLKEYLELDREKIAFSKCTYSKDYIEPDMERWRYYIKDIPFSDDFETICIEYNKQTYIDLFDALRMYESSMRESRSGILNDIIEKMHFIQRSDL